MFFCLHIASAECNDGWYGRSGASIPTSYGTSAERAVPTDAATHAAPDAHAARPASAALTATATIPAALLDLNPFIFTYNYLQIAVIIYTSIDNFIFNIYIYFLINITIIKVYITNILYNK